MKNILLLLLAASLLTACSSSVGTRNVDFQAGSVTLPDNWAIVPGDDTMPNTLMAVAPAENGFRTQFRVDTLKPFKMDKEETAYKLKESLEGKSALVAPPVLTQISGEPAVAYAWRGKEKSTENRLLTVDVTHYGYFVCADDNIYSLDFSGLTSQADEVRSIANEAIYSFETAASKARALAAEQAAREEAEARAEAERKIAREESAFGESEEEKASEEESYAAAEEEAARIEAEAKAEAKAKAKAKEKDAETLAREKVEAARAEAQKAQDEAVASARAAKEAAKVAQAKAEALSAAQMELDKINGDGFVQIQQPEVVVEEEPVAKTPTFTIENAQPVQTAPSATFETQINVTPAPAQTEVKVTAPQPAAPTQTTSPVKRTNGGLVIQMQTVN